MTRLRGHVQVVEVGPRDGLQNESVVLGVDDKRHLVLGIMGTGARRIEVTSFVNPARVPQMAGGEELLRSLPRQEGTSYIGLVLNARGAERAIAAGVDELNFVLPATDSFAARNQGAPVAELRRQLDRVIELNETAGLPLSVTIAVAFGCPYEGEVGTKALGHLLEQVLALPLAEIALADTVGCAVPADVTERFGMTAALTAVPMRAHFHDTRRTGLANVQAALDAGVRILDSSVGGLGGCPFAPGAAGNVATEDLAWMLDRSGWETGIDIDAATAVGRDVAARLSISPRSGVAAAGAFPRPFTPGA